MISPCAGHKRHILVDAQRPLLVAHTASIPDRQGGKLVLKAIRMGFPRLQRMRINHADADQR
jgi:hypothetical protein